MKRYALLILILLLALSALGCNLGGSSDEDETSEPAAVDEAPSGEEASSDEAPAAQEESSSGQEPASQEESPGDEPPAAVSGLFAQPDLALDSYRSRTVMRVADGGQGFMGLGSMEIEQEYVREPSASRSAIYDESSEIMVETITIGNDTYTNLGDGTWIKTTADDPMSAAVNPDFMSSMEDMLADMEGGMDPEGSEVVNGIRCKKDAVDADFDIDMPMEANEEAAAFLPIGIAGHVTGYIWVADEGGLPEVIIRSETTQEISLKYESRDDETVVYQEERELYDINTDIVIQAPENVMEMPGVPGGGDATLPGEQEGAVMVETEELDEVLDSYRVDWSMSMIMEEGGGFASSYQIEYVKEPRAVHLSMFLGESPFGEYLWIDDQVWVNSGGGWILGGEEDTADAFDSMGDIFGTDEDMVLMGDEVVSGIQCQYYVSDFAAVGMSIHKEVWVANQPDLPRIVVKGLFEMETTGLKMVGEGLVYDINTPITIEAPQ